MPSPPIASRLETLESLRSLREDLAAQTLQFRDMDPDYLPFAQPLALTDFLSLAQQTEAVVVSFRVTQAGAFVFLVGPEDQTISEEQVVSLPAFTDHALQKLLKSGHNGTSSGWLSEYLRLRQGAVSLTEWRTCMDQVLAQLSTDLMQPVLDRIRARYPDCHRLILVHNKGLSLLPFQATWTKCADGIKTYLVDQYEILLTPSCQVLSRCLAREGASPQRQAISSLLAIQNPDSGENVPTLPFADWEVEMVSQWFPETHRIVLAGEAATREAVKDLLERGDEKLFACHGLFDVVDVEGSHLQLAQADQLTNGDILSRDLRGTQLVVLSACESGLTELNDQVDEYQGLPAAFLLAGATTVIASLWAVNDLATCLMMQQFHENLYERQLVKASALHEAQMWLRTRTQRAIEQILEGKRRDLLAAVSSYESCGFQPSVPGIQKEGETTLVSMKGRIAVMDTVIERHKLQDLTPNQEDCPFAHPHFWAAFQCIGGGRD